MPSQNQILWEQMSAAQRARIIAILVQMVLHQWMQQQREARHDPT